MGNFRSTGLALCALVFVVILNGCAASHTETGPLIDRSNVDKIVKGKTTISEVQTMFGTPNSTSLLGDGRRMAFYMTLKSDANAQVDPKVFIPIVGGFVATTTGQGTYRQQTLQVIYTADGVVRDYLFNDSTTNTTTNIGAFSGVQTQSTTTPTSTPPTVTDK